MIYTTYLLYHKTKKNLLSFINNFSYVKIYLKTQLLEADAWISSILMIIGIFFIIISLFFKDKSKKVEKDVEELSISIYQETNSIKRRLKIVEEELLLEPNFHVATPKSAQVKQQQAMETFQQVAAQVRAAQTQAPAQLKPLGKPINSILVSQVIALNEQGLSIEEISKRSTLSAVQIQSILSSGGRQ